jgi:cytoskeleton protein RodZ
MTALPGKPASNSVQSGSDQLLAVSPGEKLQRARQALKLEVTEMAQRLNLSPGVVRALEADDYRMLPNATFVKGYLRSYARALDISGDELVRAYEAITGCNEPVKVEPVAAPMISDTRRNQRNVLLAALLLVVLGIGVWIGLTGSDPVSDAVSVGSSSLPVNEASVPAGEAVTESVNPPVVITRSQSTDAEVVASVTATDEPVEAELRAVNEPVLVPVESMQPVTDTATQSVPVETVQPVPVTVEPVVSAPVPVAPALSRAAEPAAATSPATTDGTGLVNLRFQGECWVEVRDRSGRMVFSALKRAGEEETLRAAIPIHVKLGNGDVVSVRYNHQPVNFTTRPDRKVVRLTLGE